MRRLSFNVSCLLPLFAVCLPPPALAYCPPPDCSPASPPPPPNYAQEWRSTKVGHKETYKQISRRISDVITMRLASELLPALTPPGDMQSASLSGQTPLAASADDNGSSPASVWTTFAWSSLSNDGLQANYDTDIFQSTSGFDKRFGNFIVGASVSYAYSDTTMIKDSIGMDVGSQVHTVDLTPFAAYVISPNWFISAFTGYNYSRTLPLAEMGDADTDGYNSEIALNGLQMIDRWSMRGKVGMRYQHSHTNTEPMTPGGATHRSNLDNFIALADSEIGYSFSNNLRAYTGVLFEFNSRPSLGKVEGIFYYNAGVDYWFSDRFNLGMKIQTDLNNENVDLTTVGIHARLAL
ncbi:MAG: autotransporter outer membrane beta-barrel domain-containing protein [Gammaproteobacteria bacterium]